MILIDKAALLNRIATTVHYDTEHPLEAYGKLLSEINDAPEDIVRCKDCKWGTPHPEGDEYTKCFKLCTTFFSGHYCAWGERRKDEVVSRTNGINP